MGPKQTAPAAPFLLALMVGPMASLAADNRSVINTLVVCSYNDTLQYDVEYFQFALDYVNNNLSDRGFPFQLKADFQCALQELQGSAVRKFADGYLRWPNKALLFGPAYANQAVVLANVLKYYFLPEIAASVSSPELSDKFYYPYFSRVGVSDGIYLHGVMQILKKYDWKLVGLLTSDYDAVYSISRQFEALMSAYNVSLVARGVYKTDPTDELMRMIAMDVRIFVVVRAASVETSIKFECLIKKLDLVGPKYFWIQLGVTQTFLPPPPGDPDCTPQILAAGAEGSLFFTSDLLLVGNETGMGNVTSGDLYREFLITYPYLAGAPVTISALGIRMDAVLAAAIALNSTIAKHPYSTELDLNESPFKDQLLMDIRAVDFNGFTGRVKLDGNGDRLANAVIYQIRSFERVPVGYIDTYSNIIVWNLELEFAGGSPPRDRPKLVTNQQVVSRPSAVIILSLCAVGIGLTVACVSVNHHYRHVKLIKLSSPNINNLMGLGCILCYLSCVFAAVGGSWTQDALACWLQSSSLCFGYSIAYGAMLAKTWRVHVIFANRNLRRVAIKDHHLAGIVLGLVALDATIIIVWACIDPMTVTSVKFGVVESILSGTIEANVVQSCTGSYLIVWTSVFIGYKGFLLAFGIFFAWETRAVHIESLNDSKKIGICVYNTMVMGALGVVMTFVLPGSEVNLRFLLINGCIIVCCTTALIIVFGSKIVLLIQHGPSKIDDVSNSLPGNESVMATGPGATNRTSERIGTSSMDRAM